MNILENVSLSQYTTFKIGGPAKYFVVAKSLPELKQAISWAKKNKVKWEVIGGGSNILALDQGFDGLVIRLQNKGYKIKGSVIEAEAGLALGELVGVCLKHGLAGLEWASAIPGSVGGAIRGNAGSFGYDIARFVKSVTMLEDGKLRKINCEKPSGSPANKCFGYRHSIFKTYSKKNAKKAVIVRIELKLKKGERDESLTLIKKYSQLKNHTQALEYPSAGCVFKNYELRHGRKISKDLLVKYPDLNEFIQKGIIPAGWLIDKSGLKGKREGSARISPKHANFINNLKNARSGDVIKLIQIIKRRIKSRFGLELQEEIEIFPGKTID